MLDAGPWDAMPTSEGGLLARVGGEAIDLLPENARGATARRGALAARGRVSRLLAEDAWHPGRLTQLCGHGPYEAEAMKAAHGPSVQA